MKHWGRHFVFMALLVILLGLSMLIGCDSGTKTVEELTGDRAVKQIAFDIRHGDNVVVGADSTSIAITRTVGGTPATVATYALSGDQVVNDHGTVLTNDVTDLTFSSGNGVKVSISMTLADDMGTSALEFDDQRVEINSVAICRNEAS